MQQALQLGDVDAGGAVLDGDHPGPAEVAFTGARQRSRTHVEGFGGIVAEDLVVIVQPPGRIQNDPQRTRTGHVARRELGIIGRDRARSDDHRLRERAHAVQMQDVFLARDVPGIPPRGWR